MKIFKGLSHKATRCTLTVCKFATTYCVFRSIHPVFPLFFSTSHSGTKRTSKSKILSSTCHAVYALLDYLQNWENRLLVSSCLSVSRLSFRPSVPLYFKYQISLRSIPLMDLDEIWYLKIFRKSKKNINPLTTVYFRSTYLPVGSNGPE